MKRHRINILGLWFVVLLMISTAVFVGREAVVGIATGRVQVPSKRETRYVTKESPGDYWFSVGSWMFIASIFGFTGTRVAFLLRGLK